MAKTIVICGYGPGISDAVARKFGAAGFSVALVARNAQRISTAAAALAARGIRAAAFPADVGDPRAVKGVVAAARAELGPIAVVHWNAYAADAAGDLTRADVSELRTAFDIGVTGLVAAVQEALPDLKAHADAAVLVTGGGLALYDPAVDAAAVGWNAMGLGIVKAAQHKLAGLLAEKLRGDGIYVGEVMVLGVVKGTAFDAGQGTIEADAVAAKFWDLYSRRSPPFVQIG
ncbi:MAG TPA: SDR family NAD(P)-dependent oxidoreductase [Haliangiales bacterium]|nr:SDR family NAD(P)-dependent oxidoreductase [Haliangiales bacterium]